ncbi:molybdate ABC transporter permease subunit [Listeria grayi]|uniref:molybdate ABC transporter permease subunit n=1 Tax=Listeria grayi TaxID=1641 RepID=UPI001623AB0F|nr:ABC transporter permease subunit [Listeria grayi]MBC1922146.1 ABC transporter permease subunit [Listeria grayi]
MLVPVTHSIFIAIGATLVAFLLMLPLAYIGAYWQFKGKWLLESVLLLPLVLPPTVIGLVLLQSFGKYGFLGKITALFGDYSIIFTLTGAVIATICVVLPLMYQGLKAAFLSVPIELIQVGRTLSANSIELLFRVIIPNCWQHIFASILLSFCRGLGEFGASLMVAGYIEGKTDTIATSIYFAIQQNEVDKAVMLSVTDAFIGFAALIIIYLLTNKRSRWSK